jgi:predicted outer membrane protein
MKGLRSVGLALAAVGLVLAPVARAGDEAKQLGRMAEKKTDFLDRLVRFDLQQLELGNLALERSQDPRVREFATRMVQDHRADLRTLRTWAQGRALEIAALAEDPAMQGSGGAGMEQFATAAREDREKNLEKADEQSRKAHEQLEKLSRAEPDKFDKDFLSRTIEAQKQGLNLVKAGRREFEGDVTFAAVVAKAQPVLEGHIAQAESLKDLRD